MSLLSDIQIALGSYNKAVEFIRKHGMLKLFVLPILLNILLLALGLNLVGSLTDSAIEAIQKAWEPENWEFWGAEFLAGALNFFIWLILRIFFFLFFAFIGGYVILILLSPLLAYVSEKTEKILLGTNVPFSWIQLLKDMWRGIVLAIRNFLIELMAIIILFFVSFIPVVGLISTPLLFLISSYYYGFSFMDYTAERRKLKVKESIDFVKQNKGLAIGNGLPFALALLVPVIGVSLSGFIALISTVAATMAILKKEERL